MKGSKEGTCWVVMRQNPQGPEMRSSKSEMLSKLLNWNNSDPYWLLSPYDECTTASTHLFVVSVVSLLLCSEVHKVDQTVGIWLAQCKRMPLIICD